MSERPLPPDLQLTPGSWDEVLKTTAWKRGTQRVKAPTVEDILRARIRFNEELKQYHSEFKKWQSK